MRRVYTEHIHYLRLDVGASCTRWRYQSVLVFSLNKTSDVTPLRLQLRDPVHLYRRLGCQKGLD